MPYGIDPLLAMLIQKLQRGTYPDQTMNQPINSMDQTAAFGPIEDLPEVYQQNYYQNQAEGSGFAPQDAQQIALKQVLDNRSRKLAQQQLEQEAEVKFQELQNQRQQLGLHRQELKQTGAYQTGQLAQGTEQNKITREQMGQQKEMAILGALNGLPEELQFQAAKEIQDTGRFSPETQAAMKQFKSDEQINRMQLEVLKQFKPDQFGGTQNFESMLQVLENRRTKSAGTTTEQLPAPTVQEQRQSRVDTLQSQQKKSTPVDYRKILTHDIPNLFPPGGKDIADIATEGISRGPYETLLNLNAGLTDQTSANPPRPEVVTAFTQLGQQYLAQGKTINDIASSLKVAQAQQKLTAAEAVAVLNALSGQGNAR